MLLPELLLMLLEWLVLKRLLLLLELLLLFLQQVLLLPGVHEHEVQVQHGLRLCPWQGHAVLRSKAQHCARANTLSCFLLTLPHCLVFQLSRHPLFLPSGFPCSFFCCLSPPFLFLLNSHSSLSLLLLSLFLLFLLLTSCALVPLNILANLINIFLCKGVLRAGLPAWQGARAG